ATVLTLRGAISASTCWPFGFTEGLATCSDWSGSTGRTRRAPRLISLSCGSGAAHAMDPGGHDERHVPYLANTEGPDPAAGLLPSDDLRGEVSAGRPGPPLPLPPRSRRDGQPLLRQADEGASAHPPATGLRRVRIAFRWGQDSPGRRAG